MDNFTKTSHGNTKKNKRYKLPLSACLLVFAIQPTYLFSSVQVVMPEAIETNKPADSSKHTNAQPQINNNSPQIKKEQSSADNLNKKNTQQKDKKRNEKKWTLNYQETDLQEFISQIANITGYTFILDPKLQGSKKVNVLSSKAMTLDEVYEIFLYTLSSNELAVIRKKDNVYQIMPLPLSKTSGSEYNQTHKPKNAQMTIEAIALHTVSALEIIPAIKPLLAPFGHISATTTANAVLVADLQDNVNRIKKAIFDLDSAGKDDYEVLTIKHAWVSDITRVIQDTINNTKSPLYSSVHVVANERGNQLILKGNENKRAKIRELVKTLDQTGISRSSTRVTFLKHATAKNVANILSEAAQHITTQSSSSPIGIGRHDLGRSKQTAFVKADESTNSILIIAEPNALKELENLAHQLDIKRPQVLIEAAVAEISGDRSNNIGFQWGINGKNTTLGTQQAGDSFNNDSPNQSLTGSFLGNNKIEFGSFAWRFAHFGFVLNLLSSQTNTNLLSTPTILTLDNEQAELSVGQEVPFKTGSYSNNGSNNSPFTTTERKPVGLNLKVTPHIGDSNRLRLEIEQEISSLIPHSAARLGTSDVVTDRRKLKTTVSVENGQTIVMGGLLQDSIKKNNTYIPLLGRIPLIKSLFSNRNNSHEKKNLMLFIKTTILQDPSELSDITQSKYNTLRNIRTSQHAILPMNASKLFEFKQKENNSPIL
ncbi:MAG: type II secretion system secretin GspD [Endozoicomonadaceae bacterium]|nr:type II secretion system secretin GspD [Endozoicomonadaceae bacterium]